jgi:hypothetical protein
MSLLQKPRMYSLQRTGQRERKAGIATVANSGEAGPHYSLHDTSAECVAIPAVRPRVCGIAGPLRVPGRNRAARPVPVICWSDLPY